jgi:O-antigen/teichoic acid export membrane protein
MAKHQKDPAKLVEIYKSAMFMMAAILFPSLGMVAVAGEAVFSVMLSEAWAPVAPIFAFSIAGLTVEAIAIVLIACLFRAVGRTDLHVLLTLEGSILRIILVVLAAYFFNVEGVAIAISIWGFIIAPRGWHLAARIVPLTISGCLRVLVTPAIISVAMMAIHIVLRQTYNLGHVSEIGLSAGILLIGFGGIYILLNKQIKAAIRVFQT